MISSYAKFIWFLLSISVWTPSSSELYNLTSTLVGSPTVGFFEVSSSDEKRVYFNYADLFLNEDLPPYYVTCDDFFTPDILRVDLLSGTWLGSPLVEAIENGFQYYDNQY